MSKPAELEKIQPQPRCGMHPAGRAPLHASPACELRGVRMRAATGYSAAQLSFTRSQASSRDCTGLLRHAPARRLCWKWRRTWHLQRRGRAKELLLAHTVRPSNEMTDSHRGHVSLRSNHSYRHCGGRGGVRCAEAMQARSCSRMGCAAVHLLPGGGAPSCTHLHVEVVTAARPDFRVVCECGSRGVRAQQPP